MSSENAMIQRETDDGRAALAELGLGGPPELLDADLGEDVRVTPLRRTQRVTLGAGRECYLKQYRPGAGRAGKVARRRAPAAVEWDALASLRSHGVRVPAGLCAVWSDGGDRRASAILLAGVHGAERLDEALARARPGEADEWLVRCFARWVRRLHDAGFQHRDLYACHVLVGPGWRAEPTLIDVARVRQSARLSRRRRTKDLAALHHSLAPVVRRAQLLRMFLRYRDERSPSRASRRLLRGVLRKAARIAGHEPKY